MKYSLILFCFLHALALSSQQHFKVTPATGETLPEWAKMMYAENPNTWVVDDGYRKWRQSNPEAKTTYSQYYKKWRRSIEPFINNKGYVQIPTTAEKNEFEERLHAIKQTYPLENRNAGWTVMGPIETFNTNQGPSPLAKSSQVNVYCFDQSLSHPDILYCGTEGGEIYKSVDKGQNWSCVSRAYDLGAPEAIEIHPTNPDIVYVGERNRLQRTQDGGQTWEVVHEENNFYINDIKINPVHHTIILVAAKSGLYRTENGDDFDQLSLDACYDIEWKTDDPDVAFLVQHDPALNICQFYKSTNAGVSWQLKNNNGWFFSDMEGRHDGGARIAVTDADPNRVYAVLIGEAKTGDDGFIGIYRSDDAGETWTLPNGPAGGPYIQDTHPNMVGFSWNGGYHQGFYNLGFDASDSNPNELLAGFMSIWKSTDGAASWTCFGGYCHNDFNYVHPDCQEIEINGDDVWMTSDGGIEYSNDFFQTHYAVNRGITGSDYWGFGTGWNEDILVGGRYHNGNSGWHENWMPGECLSLGGGEAPTGYVNPGPGRKTYFSDLGGVILPESQNGHAEYISFGKFPNESYYDAESGEVEFYPLSWNTIFVTNENKIWKTKDGGSTWDILYEFGTDINARAMQFEISRSNPDVMYLFQRDENTWDEGLLFRTDDGGHSWDTLILPDGYARRVVMAIHELDENTLWIAYPDGNDGELIYKTNDGGKNWENLTTSNLNGEHITYLLRQGGLSEGVLYIGTFRTVWYRTDNSPDWFPYNEGLPKSISTCILRPFYRDNKIRMGAYGKGIWEAPFLRFTDPIVQPMANKLETACPGDTIEFDDYSMLDHSILTSYHWYFEGGTPSESNERNPHVVYHTPGDYDVYLGILYSGDKLTDKLVENMIHVLEPEVNSVPPDINFSASDHFTIHNPDGGITWTPVELNGCDPEGDTVMYVNNYENSSYGLDEIVLPVNMDLTQVESAALRFNVAYAPYYDGNAFIDSLHVLISNNCEKSFHYLFRSGGEELSTTASGQGPNNLYEYDRFIPRSCEEWREVEIDLADYIGQYVTIKFLNKSGYGNQMYLDDISIETILVGTEDPDQPISVSIEPNPTNGVFSLTTSVQNGKLEILDATGRLVLTKTKLDAKEIISLEQESAGLYFVKVISEDANVRTKKLIKQ